jgi:hypothetical protein
VDLTSDINKGSALESQDQGKGHDHAKNEVNLLPIVICRQSEDDRIQITPASLDYDYMKHNQKEDIPFRETR